MVMMKWLNCNVFCVKRRRGSCLKKEMGSENVKEGGRDEKRE